jgi:hypothetical protein
MTQGVGVVAVLIAAGNLKDALRQQLEAGKGKRFASVDALMADLHADD